MKRAFARIGGYFVTAAWWVLLGARFVLELIGYSTVPDDIGVAQTRLDQLFSWFLSVPWWALLGLAAAATFSLMYLPWSRPWAKQSVPELPSEGSERTEGESMTVQEFIEQKLGPPPRPASTAPVALGIDNSTDVAFIESLVKGGSVSVTRSHGVDFVCPEIDIRNKKESKRE